MAPPRARSRWTSRVYAGGVELGSRREPFDAKIDLVWRPRPEFRLSASPHNVHAHVELGRARLRLDVLGRSRLLHVLVDKVEFGSAVVEGAIEPGRFSTRRALASLRFVVPNFPDLQPAAPVARGRSVWAGRVVATGGGWELTLDSQHGSPMRDGTYSVTHVGDLNRSDGQAFTTKQAVDALEATQAALSFCRGRYSSPWLATGYDLRGNVGFQEWSPRLTDAWSGVLSWCPFERSSAFSEAYGALLGAWAHPFHRDVLQHVLPYYMSANGSGFVESRLMLAQAGLELMTWFLLVEWPPTRWLSPRDHKSAKAEDLLPELLRWARIRETFPRWLPRLRALAKQEGWKDAPTALVRLRNEVTHPRRRNQLLRRGEPVWVDAWLLATHYLELVLLRWVGYRGLYLNRLHRRTVWDTTRVPWA
jgi:hypothetical protein